MKKAGSNIRIARLKKKLGTHALPTAELELHDVPAEIVGVPGKGVKTISTILNITRIYTAMGAVSYLRRAYAVALAYSDVRMIGKTVLREKPLHAALLSRVETVLSGITHLTFYLASLLGKEECNESTADERNILRGLVPLVKAYVSKLAHIEIGECCEALGGLGYIENIDPELNIARIYRDSLVLCIWEGTTNVLALDFARALRSSEIRSSLKRRFGSAVDGIEDLRDESKLKTIMFKIAHEVTVVLVSEAAGISGDQRMHDCSRRWSAQQQPADLSSIESSTARL